MVDDLNAERLDLTHIRLAKLEVVGEKGHLDTHPRHYPEHLKHA